MFRILILGDFSGRGADARRAAPRRVDRDDVDDAIAELAPAIPVSLGDASNPLMIHPRSIDDFHPDRLIEHVEALRALAAVGASITDRAPAPRAAPPPRAAAPTEGLLSGAGLLDQILGADPAPVQARPATAPPRDDLSEFIARAVQPHVVPAEQADATAVKAKIDETRQAMLRVILHDRAFRDVEAAWRGVEFIARRIDTSEDIELRIADMDQAALIAAIANPAALARALGESVSLVLGLYSFGLADVATLTQVTALAQSMRAPWIVGGSADVIGAARFADNGDPDDWSTDVALAWDELRRRPEAQWLGIAAPRFLLRVPYGKSGEPCERLAFDEFADWPDHESLLWGSPSILCGTIIGEGAESGEVPSQGTVDGLPMFVGRRDGAPEAIPCAEVLLTQRAVAHCLDLGVTPLAAQKDGDAIRLPRLQSVAKPPAPLAIATGLS